MMRCENELKDNRLVTQLYKSGCRYIVFGVETLTPGISKIINKLMNQLQKNSSMYIDCKTSKKQRDIIINKYKK